MPALLNDLEIPYQFATAKIEETEKTLEQLKTTAIKGQKPVALIFRPNLIEKADCNCDPNGTNAALMTREQILEILLPKMGEQPIVTTTGKMSRELFELREKYHQSHKFDFLTVGSMGCASGIGLGIASQTKKNVYVIDGDGAALMKLGTLATIGNYKPKNLIHILIDNGAYESTGGQPTVSVTIHWGELFKSVGYKKILIIKTEQELRKLQFDSNSNNYPLGIIIYSKPGSRANLGRPTSTPIENKGEFMEFLSNV